MTNQATGISAGDFRVPGWQKRTLEEQARLDDEAFEIALESYPLDNRRRYEGFRDGYVETKPKPPREGAPYTHGDQEGVCKVTESHLRANFPDAFSRYGALNVRLALLKRLGEMERIRREGRPKAEGAKTAREWNPG